MRRFYAAAAIVITLFVPPLSVHAAEIPAGNVLEFQAFRNGSPIGSHRLAFRQEGARVTVDVAIRLKVDLAFVTLYRYEHDSQELWENGRLIGVATRTNDDGKKTEVRATAEGQILKVEGSGGRLELPLGTFPTSYWDRDITKQTLLLDTQDGIRTVMKSGPPVRETYRMLGKDVPADKFSVTGDLTLDLWYSPKGAWIGLRFVSKGSEITYSRLTPLEE